MNSGTTNRENLKPLLQELEIDWLELAQKVWISRKPILMACVIGAVFGLIVSSGIPKEYTASTLIVPESRKSSSGISGLTNMVDIDVSSSSSTERDAIFPSLYPAIVNSTPFLVRLFDIKVREQSGSTVIALSRYLKERQKRPWWSTITSAPFRLIGWTISLFSEKEEVDPFRLTREEAGIAGTIASRINIEVDKKKRTITIFVTMQDPLVAAVVADTVRAHLKEYVTEYRTAKARKILEYAENLRQEAQVEYYKTQEKYTRYADANQGLVKSTSLAELARLKNEMNLAQVMYNQTEQQVQAAIAKVEKVRPVYAVIQPVQVPLAPSKPRKMIIIVGCILVSCAGSIGWVLFAKDFLRDIKRKRVASDDR